MQNHIYLSTILLAAASPALSQYNAAPGYSPIPPAPPAHTPVDPVPVHSTAPVSSADSVMPSFTTKTLTSALTVTSFLTVTSSAQYGTGDIIGPIEGLAQCSQTIIFNCLQDSKCNPADFPCICAELKSHDVEAKVAAACKPEDKDHYLKFQADVCNNIKPTDKPSGYPVHVTSSAAPSGYPVHTPSAYPVHTPSAYPVHKPSGYPVHNTTSTAPAKNETSTAAPPVHPAPSVYPAPPAPHAPAPPAPQAPAPSAYPAPPAPQAPAPVTSTIVVTSTNAAGQPTTMQQTVVGPAPTGPATPEYTGAAAVLNVQNAVLAGGVGLMGLVFAAL